MAKFVLGSQGFGPTHAGRLGDQRLQAAGVATAARLAALGDDGRVADFAGPRRAPPVEPLTDHKARADTDPGVDEGQRINFLAYAK